MFLIPLEIRGPHPPLTIQNLLGNFKRLVLALLKSYRHHLFFKSTRLDELYLSIGGLGGQKQEINPKMTKKTVYVNLKKYSSEYLLQCGQVKRRCDPLIKKVRRSRGARPASQLGHTTASPKISEAALRPSIRAGNSTALSLMATHARADPCISTYTHMGTSLQ